MPYSTDLNFAQWSATASSAANTLEIALKNGALWQRKFSQMTYGLSDQQILALPAFAGRTQADLDSIRACFNTMKQLNDAFTGVAALGQYDYSGYFLPFEW